MADTKFTPGPWRPVSMHLEGPDGQTVQDELPGHPDYHLRIAAPELYAALQKALPILDYIVENGWDEAPPLGWQPNETEALNGVLAALRKARGEA